MGDSVFNFKTIQETIDIADDLEFFKYAHRAYRYKEYYTAVANSPLRSLFIHRLQGCRKNPKVERWRLLNNALLIFLKMIMASNKRNYYDS